MSSRLAPCLGCARHVRIEEGRCPFCEVVLHRSAVDASVLEPPPPGLSRAGLYTHKMGTVRAVAGAALLAAAAACESPAVSAAYGGPPPSPSSQTLSPDAAAPTPSALHQAVPAYGAPPPSPPPVPSSKP
jgi:hypothetical protein